MLGGKRHRRTVVVDARKGWLLSADERRTAQRLKALRFSVQEIARAIGRSVAEVREFINSPEARL